MRLLRNSSEAQPPHGILAAAAACQIGKYIMNFINRIEGLMSMPPLRHIEEPVHKYFEYNAFANTIDMRSTGAAVVTELGMGSEFGLVAPTGVSSLIGTGIAEKLEDSTAGAPHKRKSGSGPSKPFAKRRM